MVYFLLIPNGPAGLLVSVNEEPVHAIGILFFLFFLLMFKYICEVGQEKGSPTRAHS